MRRILLFLLCLNILILPARAMDGDKYVALTFDDGPSGRFTTQLLDGLQERRVKATFLLCGYRMEQFPEITQRIFSEGHEIGYHGYSHKKAVQGQVGGVNFRMVSGDYLNFQPLKIRN